MKNQLLSLEDILEKTNIDKKLLNELLDNAMIFPAQRQPILLIYARDIEKIKTIVKLYKIGYKFSTIKKILLEIGFPQDKQKDAEKYFPIGKFCSMFDLNPRKIKYWESLGLFFPAMRSEGGIRLYSKSLIIHIRFIQYLQELGFSLLDIKNIIDNIDVKRVEKRITHINEIIKELKPILKNMKQLL